MISGVLRGLEGANSFPSLLEIQETLCMLASVKLKGKGHEFHLKGKWMAPIPFILALKEAGLNIFPAIYSHFYVVVNNKVPQVELKAYRQMALLSAAFSFGWSKWNMVCNSTRVVFRVKYTKTASLSCHPERKHLRNQCVDSPPPKDSRGQHPKRSQVLRSSFSDLHPLQYKTP